jgi:trimeric autotransporter adhesin
MKHNQVLARLLPILLFGALEMWAQQSALTASAEPYAVPRLVKFNSTLKDANGKPVTGTVGITFLLYRDEHDGAPLWIETQNINLDAGGRYSVTLGSTTSRGLPAELFTTSEARWLGVQAQGQQEQPRVLLLSVPYALKALDAETLGGKPASAFVTTSSSGRNSGLEGAPPGTITGSGTKGHIPKFTGATTIGNSAIFQNNTGNVGVGTTTPAANLDVNGTSDIRNTLTLFPNGSAPTLSVNGTALSINNKGTVNFVNGQKFPGTGTITGVTAGTDLTGGGTSNNVTLNLDTTKVPQLNAANTFTGNQVINGNLSDAGNISAAGSIVGQTGSLTANSNGEVLLVTQNGSGGALVGQSSGSQGVAGLATATSGVTTGVSGVSESTTGFGVEGAGATGVRGVGLSSKGAAGLFENQNGGAILIGLGPGLATVFNVDGSGNLTTNGSINSVLTLQGNVTDPCSGLVSANVIGGTGNIVNNGVTGATIGGGGSGNVVTDDFGTVGGGERNESGDNSGSTCDASFATVAGGGFNTAGRYASTVAGGDNNTASGPASIVAGGELNTASGDHSTVAGGVNNTASGQLSFVAGGVGNEAFGDFSFAAGQNAVTTDSGAFLWCASGGTQCGSAGTNSFEVAVYGPIFFYDGPNGSGCNLTAGGGSWNCSSDRNLKDSIVPIDSRLVLERVAHLPITQWKMKAEPAGRKHIGPMAQDFYAAFGLGDNDRYIALGDGQGVALAAIQALYQVVQQKDGQIRKLRQQLEVVRATEGQLKKQIQDLHHAQSQKITSLEERLTRLEVQDRTARTAPIATEARSKQRSSQPGGGI